MAFRLVKKASAEKNVRRIAREQITLAIGEIENQALDRHEAVHQVRKRCKRLRGLIRLVRPVFGDYASENAFLRDAARSLSAARDFQSVVEALDEVAAQHQGRVDEAVFQRCREKLLCRRDGAGDGAADDLAVKLEEFRAGMAEALERVHRWRLSADGFAAMGGGLAKTYRRGRMAMQLAYEQPSAYHFHDWRKRVKYHWFHCELLVRIWPEMMKIRAAAADELADILGREHDLAVLHQLLVEEKRLFGEDAVPMGDLIAERRRQLQKEARPLGQRLYAEPDKQLARRFGAYWATWHSK